MTTWASLEAAAAVGQQLLGSEVATTFFATFDFKAYAMVRPPAGFDLTTLAAAPGQVSEQAV